jgi:hypothetical protein
MGCNGDFWCDAFVDWCFVSAFGDVDAKRLLGGYSNYTPTSSQYFKNMKQWYTKNPEVGDVVFYKNSERINHTGIVYGVDNTYIYTVEGNTSSTSDVEPNGGGVFLKKYLLTNSKIAGYGRPNYDEYIPVDLPITKISSKEDVKWLQDKLNIALFNAEGFVKLTVDGIYGRNTENAVIKFYELQGWETKGLSVGKNAVPRLAKY